MKHGNEDVPAKGRLIAAGMAVAGGIGLLMNHFIAQSQNVVGLFLLLLGPLAVFLGAGGMIEPKMVWSVGKYGKHLPVKYKIVGVALDALGLVVTFILVFFVYRPGAPGTVPER